MTERARLLRMMARIVFMGWLVIGLLGCWGEIGDGLGGCFATESIEDSWGHG